MFNIGRADIDIRSKFGESMKTLEPQKQHIMTAKQIWDQTKICRFKRNYPPQSLISHKIQMDGD